MDIVSDIIVGFVVVAMIAATVWVLALENGRPIWPRGRRNTDGPDDKADREA